MKITIQSKQYRVYDYIGFVKSKNLYAKVVFHDGRFRTAVKHPGRSEWELSSEDPLKP